MKKALISPNESVSYVSDWNKVDQQYIPIYTVLGERVAEVVDQDFEVALPLFWTNCQDTNTAENSYFDKVTQSVKTIPDSPPKPFVGQPVVNGAQIL